MTREEKLKPCPFCGGKAKIHSESSFSSHDNYKIWVYAKCPKCNISTKAFDSYTMKWSPYIAEIERKEAIKIPRAKAIEVWNKRSDD